MLNESLIRRNPYFSHLLIVGAATSISSSQCIGAEMAHTFLSYVEGEEEEEEEEDSSSDDAAIDDDDEVD